MAGGESQLCVVVADRLLNRFFRICGQMLSAIARLTLVSVMAHIRTGSHTEFVIRGKYSVFKELAEFFSVAQEGLNCYLGCEKRFFAPSLYRP